MEDRRLVGIDLPDHQCHTVRVLAGDSQPGLPPQGDPHGGQSRGRWNKPRWPRPPRARCLRWWWNRPARLPIAVFFAARGHIVYRVSSAKAHDLRRVLSRHTKSNGIDADTLAR
jgi:hypothetical protein